MFNTKKIKESEFGCDCLLLFIFTWQVINDLFIPRERCNKLQLLSLSCVNNLQFNRLRLFELNYFEFPVISNLNQFPFGLDLPFTHLLSVILNSRYFKLFCFPWRFKITGFNCMTMTIKTTKQLFQAKISPSRQKKY